MQLPNDYTWALAFHTPRRSKRILFSILYSIPNAKHALIYTIALFANSHNIPHAIINPTFSSLAALISRQVEIYVLSTITRKYFRKLVHREEKPPNIFPGRVGRIANATRNERQRKCKKMKDERTA